MKSIWRIGLVAALAAGEVSWALAGDVSVPASSTAHLTGTILKTGDGPKIGQTWNIMVINTGSGEANDAQIDGFTVTLQGGSVIAPVFHGQDPNKTPIPLGNLPPGRSANVSVGFEMGNVTGQSYFIDIRFSANGGTVRGEVAGEGGAPWTGNLSGAIAKKAGPLNTNVWTITLKNVGKSMVKDARIEWFDTYEASNSIGAVDETSKSNEPDGPVLVGQDPNKTPILLGDIPPGGSASVDVMLNLSNMSTGGWCEFTFSADGGATTGQIAGPSGSGEAKKTFGVEF